MPDTYANFYALSRDETPGIDFRIHLTRADAAIALVAPHGGGIEPGTSEIAEAIAGERFSCYSFDGLKRSGNSELHITSTHFDEPMCIALIAQSDVVVTIHGEAGEASDAAVFLGGSNNELGEQIGTALTNSGFLVRPQPNRDLLGLEPCNLCNRGRSARGVQLELSLALRRTMFQSLTREGRRYPQAPFEAFVAAVSQALDQHSPLPNVR
ncbi:MAG: poly-gamma-glutamate hydrolase family protein [Deltaproteobacteria bacterium]